MEVLWLVPLCVCVVQSTPRHLAAGYNRVGVVKLLLQHGADVHAKDKGLAPLIIVPYSTLLLIT